MFVKAGTCSTVSGRKYTSSSVSNPLSKCKKELKLKSVESRMQRRTEDDPSDQLLSTLLQCLADNSVKTKLNSLEAEDQFAVALENESEQREAEEILLDEDGIRNNANRTEEDIDEMRLPEEEANASKLLGFNPNIIVNMWKKGNDLLISDNIKKKRMVAWERFQNKMKVMKEMGMLLKEDAEGLYSGLRNSTNELVQEDWICLRTELSRFK